MLTRCPPPPARYAKSEIRFNLMAVIADRLQLLGGRLVSAEKRHARLLQHLSAAPAGAEAMHVSARALVSSFTREGGGGLCTERSP